MTLARETVDDLVKRLRRFANDLGSVLVDEAATALLAAWDERDAMDKAYHETVAHCEQWIERAEAAEEKWREYLFVSETLSEMLAGETLRRKAAEAKLAQRDAENARLREWQDVVFWTDDDEKTFFSWAAGGGDPDGEFSKIGLRRIAPDGTEVFREYVALSPWRPAALNKEPKP